MNQIPLVSVIIPSWNSAKYLKETVNSVISQSYSSFEIIIVDDSSEDNSLKVAEKLAGQDSRISVYCIPHSGRPSVPRNYGASKARGEYLAFLDADDLWTKNKLKEQLYVLNKYPESGFVYSASVTFGDVNLFSPYYEVLPLIFRAAMDRNDLIKKGNTIPLSGVVVRTGIFREAGGFDEDPELQIEDYDLWLRLAAKCSFRFLPRLHVLYRIHASQFSADWETKKKRLDYLAEKRNLNLPPYRFIRRKGGLLLFIRNMVHFKVYLLYRLMGLF